MNLSKCPKRFQTFQAIIRGFYKHKDWIFEKFLGFFYNIAKIT